MTINFGDLRRGVAIEVDGQPYEVVDYERHKMQQRAPRHPSEAAQPARRQGD